MRLRTWLRIPRREAQERAVRLAGAAGWLKSSPGSARRRRAQASRGPDRKLGDACGRRTPRGEAQDPEA